jgi:hypothetical protein
MTDQDVADIYQRIKELILNYQSLQLRVGELEKHTVQLVRLGNKQRPVLNGNCPDNLMYRITYPLNSIGI